jgi:hypothetical protein
MVEMHVEMVALADWAERGCVASTVLETDRSISVFAETLD